MMKVLASLLLLLALAGVAHADYEPARVYVICILDYDMDGLSAAEFAIGNLPAPEVCTVTPHWNTDLIIGDIATGIAVAFYPPLEGPRPILGYLEFMAWEPVGDDYVIEVVPSPETGNLVVVDTDYMEEIPAWGGIHTFNCTWWCDCELDGLPAIGLFADEAGTICEQILEAVTTPAEASSFGAVKALY